MTYELTGGFLALSALLPFYLQKFPSPNIIPVFSDWLWLLFLSWVCSVWAFPAFCQCTQKISAFTVNLTYNLEPVYGILLAFAVYHENEKIGNFVLCWIDADTCCGSIANNKSVQEKKQRIIPPGRVTAWRLSIHFRQHNFSCYAGCAVQLHSPHLSIIFFSTNQFYNEAIFFTAYGPVRFICSFYLKINLLIILYTMAGKPLENVLLATMENLLFIPDYIFRRAMPCW